MATAGLIRQRCHPLFFRRCRSFCICSDPGKDEALPSPPDAMQTPDSLGSRLIVGGFPRPNLTRKLLYRLDLPFRVKSIIFGSLLGNGRFQKSKLHEEIRFTFRQSAEQEEYFQWKVNALQKISAPVEEQRLVVESSSQKFMFRSQSLKQLSQIHFFTHWHNNLYIQRRWLNHMTQLSLAVWWCDKGSIVGNGRRGVICTDDFDERSILILLKFLQAAWKVDVHVGISKRPRPRGAMEQADKDGGVSCRRLWLSTEELKKCLRIIMPHIPVKSMVHKALIVYQDPKAQDLWVAEMKSAMPEFCDAIDESLTKAKLKFQRKEDDKSKVNIHKEGEVTELCNDLKANLQNW